MKYKPRRNERKKVSHENRYGMKAREWTNFLKTATKEEILAVRERARNLLNKIKPKKYE